MNLVIGIDGVGLGALAGPIIIAAVVMERDQTIKGVRDSKKVSKNRRIDLVHDIDQQSLYWIMAQSSSKSIDKYGIRTCNLMCMKWCAKIAMKLYPDALVIVDGTDPVPDIAASKQRVVIKGDDKFMSVGAASIMAKVQRDKYMVSLSTEWPAYLFHDHKGYPVTSHLIALRKYGPCPEHRMSYGPVERASKRGTDYGR